MRKLLNAVWSFPLSRIFAFLAILLFVIIICEPVLVFALGKIGICSGFVVLLWAEFWHLAVSFALVVLFAKKVEHARLSDFGITARNFAVEILTGAVFGTLLIVGSVAVMYGIGIYKPISHSSGSDLLLAAGILFFAAATEELIFRSYVFNVLEKHWGTIAAVIISSTAFGFAHMLNHVGGSSVQSKILFCTFLSLEAGVSLAACYVFTRRLWMPIGAHWMWNFFEGPVLGTHVSGADFGQSYVSAAIEGPMLLTGGNFGPEGSVICLLIGTIGGVLILYFAEKRNNFVSYAEAQKRLAERDALSDQVAA